MTLFAGGEGHLRISRAQRFLFLGNMIMVSKGYTWKPKTRPRGYRAVFMLNSTEHEISTAHKTQMLKKVDIFCCRIYHL